MKSKSFFVDNSSELWGEIYSGVLVREPEILKKYKRTDNYFVMVTSSKYSDIKKQLLGYGLIENDDFMWAEYFLAGVDMYEKNGIMTLIDQWKDDNI